MPIFLSYEENFIIEFVLNRLNGLIYKNSLRVHSISCAIPEKLTNINATSSIILSFLFLCLFADEMTIKTNSALDEVESVSIGDLYRYGNVYWMVSRSIG